MTDIKEKLKLTVAQMAAEKVISTEEFNKQLKSVKEIAEAKFNLEKEIPPTLVVFNKKTRPGGKFFVHEQELGGGQTKTDAALLGVALFETLSAKRSIAPLSVFLYGQGQMAYCSGNRPTEEELKKMKEDGTFKYGLFVLGITIDRRINNASARIKDGKLGKWDVDESKGKRFEEKSPPIISELLFGYAKASQIMGNEGKSREDAVADILKYIKEDEQEEETENPFSNAPVIKE